MAKTAGHRPATEAGMDEPIRRFGTEHAWRATCLLSALVIVTWLAIAEQSKKGST
jgi:hypothetical protein